MNRSAKKELIRKRLLEERRSLAFETVYELSLRAQKRLLKTSLFRDAARVCLYCSSQNEVLTDEVFEKARAAGKEVFYPRVVVSGAERRLGFFRVHGLEERGGRLGFGKGYYDMALQGARGRTVALAYEFQVLKKEEIPVEPHDVTLSAIVTDERVIDTGYRAGE